MAVKIERIDDVRPPHGSSRVRLKRTGNFTEVRYMANDPAPRHIELPDGQLVDVDTGEVFRFERNESTLEDSRTDIAENNDSVVKLIRTAVTRAENPATVRQSLRNLRDIINCNTVIPNRCRWVTLTYRENMRDPVRLYSDLKSFTKRLRYYLDKKLGISSVEYIFCIEPQVRGAFHAHIIFVFREKAPYIPNAKMEQLWRHGFTKTKRLGTYSNPGVYLTAYLTDMDFAESARLGLQSSGIKDVNAKDGEGKPISKAIAKGARVHLYPAGMRIFRVSKGIKRPTLESTFEGLAMQKLGGAKLVYERTIRVSEGEAIYNIINYRVYETKRKRRKKEVKDE